MISISLDFGGCGGLWVFETKRGYELFLVTLEVDSLIHALTKTVKAKKGLW